MNLTFSQPARIDGKWECACSDAEGHRLATLEGHSRKELETEIELMKQRQRHDEMMNGPLTPEQVVVLGFTAGANLDELETALKRHNEQRQTIRTIDPLKEAVSSQMTEQFRRIEALEFTIMRMVNAIDLGMPEAARLAGLEVIGKAK